MSRTSLSVNPAALAEAEDQLVVIVRLVSRPGDRLQPLFLGDVLGDRLAHVLELEHAGIEHAELGSARATYW